MIETDNIFSSREENSMKKLGIAALLIICSVLFLSSCSASFQEEQKAAKKAAETAFSQKPKDANNNNEEIDYYLPFGVEVEEESPNNLILKNGSKTYILFYNQNEGKGSKVVYESAKLQNESYEVDETFQYDGRFGFILIKKLDDDKSELIVGSDGVKITTETKTSSLKEDASMMIDIVNSVQMK
jgi:hypothetical protein